MCECDPEDTGPGCARRLQDDINAKRRVIGRLSQLHEADAELILGYMARVYEWHPEYAGLTKTSEQGHTPAP